MADKKTAFEAAEGRNDDSSSSVLEVIHFCILLSHHWKYHMRCRIKHCISFNLCSSLNRVKWNNCLEGQTYGEDVGQGFVIG